MSLSVNTAPSGGEGEAAFSARTTSDPPSTPLLKRKDFLGIDTEAAQHPNRTYFFKPDLDEVIETCTRKLLHNPRHAKALLVRGSSHYKRAAYDLAVADLDACLALDAGSTEALYYRGMALSRQGLHERAIADYSQVLAADPSHVNAGGCFLRPPFSSSSFVLLCLPPFFIQPNVVVMALFYLASFSTPAPTYPLSLSPPRQSSFPMLLTPTHTHRHPPSLRPRRLLQLPRPILQVRAYPTLTIT